MYSTIVFMYSKYSENYHDVLKHCIYVQEVQHLLSRCTQTFYLCTESTVQTITMYLNIGFMYMRCYSANYHLALNHVFIYVHDVLQRKPSLYALNCIYLQEVQLKLWPLYLCTGGAIAQTITMYSIIVFMYRRCYSAKYHYVLKLCIYVQEMLELKILLCT